MSLSRRSVSAEVCSAFFATPNSDEWSEKRRLRIRRGQPREWPPFTINRGWSVRCLFSCSCCNWMPRSRIQTAGCGGLIGLFVLRDWLIDWPRLKDDRMFAMAAGCPFVPVTAEWTLISRRPVGSGRSRLRDMQQVPSHHLPLVDIRRRRRRRRRHLAHAPNDSSVVSYIRTVCWYSNSVSST